MSLKHRAGQAAFTTAASLAALLFSGAVATAEPAPAPQDPGATNNAKAEEEQREENPPAKQACEPWCEVIEAAQQLPPPDFSGMGLPPMVDVAVPVGVGLPGLALPDLVPDVSVPIGLPAPQMPSLQPPPGFDLTKLGQLPF